MSFFPTARAWSKCFLASGTFVFEVTRQAVIYFRNKTNERIVAIVIFPGIKENNRKFCSKILCPSLKEESLTKTPISSYVENERICVSMLGGELITLHKKACQKIGSLLSAKLIFTTPVISNFAHTASKANYRLIGLYRIRLGFAPSSPKRFRLSASYS